MDPDLESLLNEDDNNEKRLTLSNARRKGVTIAFLPILLLISISLLLLSIFVIDLCFLMFIFSVSTTITMLILLVYLRLNWKIPVQMVLDEKRIKIEYIFPFQDRSFTWKDIKDIKIYDHILLDNGKKLHLKQVLKEDWDEIMDSLMKADALIGSDSEKMDQDLLNIIKKRGQKPDRTVIIEGISFSYLVIYTLLLVLAIFGILAGPAGLILGILKGDPEIVYRAYYLFAVTIPGFPLAVVMILRITRKKRIVVGPDGVTFSIKNKLIVRSPWSNIRQCFTGDDLNGNMEVLGIITKDGATIQVNHHEIRLNKLKEGFSLMKEYCAFYEIEMKNGMAW